MKIVSGIDVGKGALDVALYPAGPRLRMGNDAAGFAELAAMGSDGGSVGLPPERGDLVELIRTRALLVSKKAGRR